MDKNIDNVKTKDKDIHQESDEEFILTDNELCKSIIKLRTIHGKEQTILRIRTPLEEEWDAEWENYKKMRNRIRRMWMRREEENNRE